MISITYPSEVSVTTGTLAAELLSPSVINPLAFTLTSSERKIEISDMFPSGATSGDTYQFTLKNIQNSDSASTTSSFRVTTYVSSVGLYRIDTISTGLTMTANCDYPCGSCSTDTSSCLSCLTAIPTLYLQDNACVTECDEGKLPVGDVCGDCSSTCTACATTNANECTKCGLTGFEFLSGTTCTSTCPAATYGNVVSFTCDSCDTASAFCATCTGNSVT
jgi:hypothetical protein